MDIIFLLLPLTLLLVLCGLLAYIWVVRSGQLDELDTQSFQPLLDESQRLDQAKEKKE